MSFLKKTFTAFLAVGAIVIFSGCGQKDSGLIDDSQLDSKASENETYAANLPLPTGNLDDAASAILNETESEQADISAEEQDALNSIGDSGETDNFSNAYDENEF